MMKRAKSHKGDGETAMARQQGGPTPTSVPHRNTAFLKDFSIFDFV
jgi:hypothetical protein